MINDLFKNGELFSNPIIMNKKMLTNLKFLQTLGRNVKGEAKAKVDKVIELYRTRQISQVDTAEKTIVKLKSTTKKEQDKAFKTYKKLIAKHGNKAPLNERLADSNKNKHFTATVLLYILPTKDQDETQEEFHKRMKKKK